MNRIALTSALFTVALTLNIYALGIPSITLDVKDTAAEKKVKDHFKTDYGSYDKRFERSAAIEIELRASGKEQKTVKVVTYWIGSEIRKRTNVLLRKTVATVMLEGGQPSQKLQSESGSVKGSDMKLTAINVRDRDGYKIEGWIVFVKNEKEEIVVMKASTPDLEQLGKDPEKLKLLPPADQ